MTQGNVWKFEDNVDTDQIISSQYLLLSTIDEMKGYAFESLRPDFVGAFTSGDMIVGGYNFGCGSSREQAPAVLKALGASVVIARSFARIFFRNSINIGLPLIICDALYDDVQEGNALAIDFEKGEIRLNESTYTFHKFPDHLVNIMEHGGLIE
jgi:3-isopropylmalate/(R)-2-methylmalate dehydratase small subunit